MTRLQKAIRGRKVMLDRDLSELYEVETRALNRPSKEIVNFSLRNEAKWLWFIRYGTIEETVQGRHLVLDASLASDKSDSIYYYINLAGI
ncbi:MAG TPA: ORF6N domain-containing protein [Thermodesulfovibrionales bacterium]|nr:ORF6N domain-containing protein [Thermodesulfovibrionales bacterium]